MPTSRSAPSAKASSPRKSGRKASPAPADDDAAPGPRRAIWKGAISFGLVHVPVALYPATREEDVDFDWLDKRTLDPVGYKRINKRTGREIDKDQIVKGVRQDNGDYVVLSDDEIRQAYPATTQTIDIETFVPADQISFVYLERPYYLAPLGKSAKVYALLREAMADAALIAVARIVIHNKEHLAALLPAGPSLMIGLMRWANEIRPADDLSLPAAGKSAHGFKPAELKMARQLIDEMTGDWRPHEYRDEFSAAIRTLIARKVKAGESQSVEPLEEAPPQSEGNVVDLTELLKRSLGGGRSQKKPKTARRA
ncbi:DNA end-binding protein Ku [Roseateles sp. YR242]|uniref:non-homologous end joining protein Ku n=1 Tax=Roseateles sp. YR242 TaxID=1855305 RepID=UPI0008B644D1|nr:Ku protein [Roseateles sp. YR242]SEL08709.1 DNA end-binding protein Ku [Roseateles sp. YR242]